MTIKLNKIMYLFILTFLFFPNLYYRYIFLYAFLFFGLLIISNSFYLKKNEYLLTLLIISLLFSYALIRWFLFNLSDLRDFIEIGRIVFILLALFIFLKIKFNLNSFLRIINFYVILDFLFSIEQYLKLDLPMTDLIATLYSAENQIDISLNISSRALGFSSDPSAHGLMILVFLSVLVVSYIRFDEINKKITIISIISGIITIFLSQSQTAFLGLGLLFMVVFIYYLFKQKERRYYWQFMVTISSSLFFLAIYLLDQLRYLVSLFEFGLTRSSYVKREEKLDYLISISSEHPIGIFMGYGKSYFGSYSTAMDNEHLYILLVYGLPIYVLFISMLCYFLFKLFITNDKYLQLFAITLLIGVPLAWPSAYYLVPKITLVLLILYSLYRNNNLKEKM